jgi:hypothetical protein
MSRTVFVIGFLLLLMSGAVYPQEPQKPEPQKPCTEKVKKIEDCAEGCGSWDPAFDRKRNIIAVPKEQKPKPMTLDEIRALEYPRNWALGKDRAELEKLGEGTYVQVTAYLIGVGYGDLSSANCKLGERWSVNDILILVSKEGLVSENLSKEEAKRKFGQKQAKKLFKKLFDQREASSVTAEITPRVRLEHTKLENKRNIYNWFKETLDTYIETSPTKARFVRITGLLLLDTEHIYKPLQRSTDWQISPVLQIEVCKKRDRCKTDADWTKLDDYPIGSKKQPPLTGDRISPGQRIP